MDALRLAMHSLHAVDFEAGDYNS